MTNVATILRWTPQRKKQICEALLTEKITPQSVIDTQGVPFEELQEWMTKYLSGGLAMLYVTRRPMNQADQPKE